MSEGFLSGFGGFGRVSRLLYPISYRRWGGLPGERRAWAKYSVRAQCQQRSRVLAQSLSRPNNPARRRHERFLLVRYRAAKRERCLVATSSCKRRIDALMSAWHVADAPLSGHAEKLVFLSDRLSFCEAWIVKYLGREGEVKHIESSSGARSDTFYRNYGLESPRLLKRGMKSRSLFGAWGMGRPRVLLGYPWRCRSSYRWMVSLLTSPAVERKEEEDHSAGRVRQRAGALSLVFSSAGLPLNSFHLLLAQKECSSNTSARKGRA